MLKTYAMEAQYDYDEGEKEEHVGVSENSALVSYSTYEHADEKPEHPARLYKVVTYTDFVDIPGHLDKMFIPAECIDEYFVNFHKTGDQLVHVEPVSVNNAVDELLEYDSEVNPWGIFDE